MRTFKLNRHGFKEVQKKILIHSIFIALVAALAGFFIVSANKNTVTLKVDKLIFLILGFLVVGSFGIFSALKRQKEQWETYELIIDGDTILRTQKNIPTITIKKGEPVKISESPEGHILIRPQQETNLFYIPSSIQDREELLKKLVEFGQINKEQGGKKNFSSIASLLVMGLMVVFFVSEKLYILISTGTVLTFILLWSFCKIQRSKLVDKKTKSDAYLVFLPLFSIILRLVLVLKTFGN